MKRLVVDASTLVSGVASRTKGGAPASILEAVLEADFETIACPHLIDEFRRSLRNRYFQERFAAAYLAEVVSSGREHRDSAPRSRPNRTTAARPRRRLPRRPRPPNRR